MQDKNPSEQLQPILQLADSHRLLHQYRQAEKSYRQVLKYAPNHPQALLGLGQLFLARKKPKKALGFFLTLTEKAPKEENGWLYASEVYQTLGKTQLACDLLIRGLEYHPQTGPIHYALGKIYLAQKQTETALSAFQSAVRFSAHPEAYMALSQLYKAQGELLKSWEHYEAAVALAPELGSPLNDQVLEEEWQKLVAKTSQSGAWEEVQALFNKKDQENESQV